MIHVKPVYLLFLDKVYTDLIIFRFKVEQKIDLRDTLQQLGIKNIFTKDADLSAMTADVTGNR